MYVLQTEERNPWFSGVAEPTPREFDADRYLRANPDARHGGLDAFAHWTEQGQREERQGLRPNWRFPDFQAALYLQHSPDVPALIESGAFDSAADHWWRAGRHEVACGVRQHGIEFDEPAYLDRRRDVALVVKRGGYLSGFDYWLCWGRAEDVAEGGLVTRIPRVRPGTDALSEEKQAFWKENGYVILEGVIPPERCDAATARLDQMWDTRRTENYPFCADVLLDCPDNRRVAFADAPEVARLHPYKINDTYLVEDVFREIALEPKVVEVLRWVIDGPPCLVTSLNFERGSLQEYHTDTLFMPAAKLGHMTAAWFALEDISADAGPLTYYPGSHHIPMYRFSTGLPNYIFEEWDAYFAHQKRHVDRLALAPQIFLPKKGDALIWHELLFHGGSPIKDMSMTRKSYVCHYWNVEQMNSDELVVHNGAYFHKRPFMQP